MTLPPWAGAGRRKFWSFCSGDRFCILKTRGIASPIFSREGGAGQENAVQFSNSILSLVVFQLNLEIEKKPVVSRRATFKASAGWSAPTAGGGKRTKADRRWDVCVCVIRCSLALVCFPVDCVRFLSVRICGSANERSNICRLIDLIEDSRFVSNTNKRTHNLDFHNIKEFTKHNVVLFDGLCLRLRIGCTLHTRSCVRRLCVL